jgi:hypothetical protein
MRLSWYIEAGKNVYTPEVTLSYIVDTKTIATANGIPKGKDANGVVFRSYKKRYGADTLLSIGLSDKLNKKLFSRIDGNHRLQAIESMANINYRVPISILLLHPDVDSVDSQRTEMEIFHTINSKAIPLTLVEQYRGYLNLFDVSELYEKGEEFAITKMYLQRRSAIKFNFGNCFAELDEMVLHCVKFFIDRKRNVTDALLFEAFEYLNQEILPKYSELREFKNKFAIIPFIWFWYIDKFDEPHIKNEPLLKLNGYINWFIRNKLYEVNNFDPASSIDNFEHIPRTIFMSMKFCDDTKDTYDAVEQVRDTLKRDDGIELELIKVDEHKDGHSGEIYPRIKTGIERAELVIADLTHGNHNVYHEIGYAQGLGKKVLLLWREYNGLKADDEIGSNLKMHDQVRFSSISDLRETLLKKIRQCFAI